MIDMTDKTCRHVEYRTPPRILEPVRRYFGGVIDLDPATGADNPTGAAEILTAHEDGLRVTWGNQRVFLNPPYGRELRTWVAKLASEVRAWPGMELIALLPGQRFEQEYWQRDVFNERLTAMCLVRRRVSFLLPDGTPARGNPYGSFVYLYNGDARRFARAFGDVGLCVRPEILEAR